jgi:nucleoside-triphosphatase THEP1
MNNENLILTGPIKTGKTTRLLNWLSDKENVHGIATPIVKNKRVFYDLFEKKYFPMEAGSGENEILTIGKYVFSKNGFKKAEGVIEKGIFHSQYLVIDEIGPLELKGEGFCGVLKNILNIEKRNFILLLVVRASILSEVLSFFEIERYKNLDI